MQPSFTRLDAETRDLQFRDTTILRTMSKIDELAERVERLLLRHGELQRTNALLQQQLTAVTHDRDNLRSRLNAARSRIDVLLERLPRDPVADADGAPVADAVRSAR
jgi:cell division protein ZapB